MYCPLLVNILVVLTSKLFFFLSTELSFLFFSSYLFFFRLPFPSLLGTGTFLLHFLVRFIIYYFADSCFFLLLFPLLSYLHLLLLCYSLVTFTVLFIGFSLRFPFSVWTIYCKLTASCCLSLLLCRLTMLLSFFITSQFILLSFFITFWVNYVVCLYNFVG